MKLNQSQLQAVTSGEGPMMVLAGPGSGKTTVITLRVRYLIEKKGILPQNILVVTFTKAAADEMRQRFVSMMGRSLPVSFGTFHAIFFAVLKAAYHYTAANIIREDQKLSLIREIIADLPDPPDMGSDFVRELLEEIAAVKGKMISLDHYYATSCPAGTFKDIYRAYTEQMTRNHLIDFEDMMVYTYELFRERPDILRRWQQKFQYILVDEFQDISALQYQLVRMLAAPQDNLFIVGDDDQSIYGFRGASPHFMLNFEKDYPKAARVTLADNYRCQKAIVDAACAVIAHNTHRFKKEIRAVRKEGRPVDIKAFNDPVKEVQAVVSGIRWYHDKYQVPYSQMAVIYRTHTQSRLLIEKLMAYNLPFTVQDAMTNIYHHWIAQDIFAYLRLSEGSDARADWLRVINRPNRYVSRQVFDSPHVATDVLLSHFTDRDWMFERLEKLLTDLKIIGRLTSPYAAINYIRHGIGYEEFLEGYAAEHRLAAEDLISVLDELSESARPYKTREEWLAYIEDYSRKLREAPARRRASAEDAIALTTMHHAKGLEYRIVFIIDANEKVVPHPKALLDEDIEEERRMFYVAMTRARDILHIWYLKERYGRDMAVSRFVEELPGFTDAGSTPKKTRKKR